MPKHVTKTALLKRLRQQIKEAGSQKKFADRHDMAQAYISDVLCHRREPGPKLYTALGYSGAETVFLEEA